MSAETMSWLNLNTLIGFTEKRGNAWHYKAEEQGTESNHYPGAIPIADVERRLFHWTPIEAEITATYMTDDGVTSVAMPDRKAIVRPDTGSVLGVFKDGYQIHQYPEWLVENVATILDADLQIGSAGLLQGGAQAWVQVEMPDTIETPEGVAFRPFVTASTSLNGTLASGYSANAQLVVCDNTLSAALNEKDRKVKIKHSRHSLGRVLEVREALQIVHSVGEAFEAQVKALCETEVKPKTWDKFLDAYVPMPEEDGRGRTIAETKRGQMQMLWLHDDRVSPWTGTAFGVVQAVNTWTHHFQGVRKEASRAERNMARVVTGGVDKLDRETLEMLASVS